MLTNCKKQKKRQAHLLLEGFYYDMMSYPVIHNMHIYIKQFADPQIHDVFMTDQNFIAAPLITAESAKCTVAAPSQT